MGQIILDSANDLIQGDFDNATLNNRTKFRTTTTNATTNVYVVPNGTATSAGVSVSNNSNLTNASKIVMATNGNTDTQIISGINGSGTYLPLSFYTNNALAMQIDNSGNVGIGRTSGGYKLEVNDSSLLSQNAGSTTGSVGVALAIDSKTSGAYATGQGSALQFQITNSAGGYSGGRIASINNADPFTADLVFYPRNYGFTEAMRINSAGSVMINTTSSAGRFHVSTGSFNPSASGNLLSTAIVASGGFGGGVSIVDGTQGYTLWSQNNGADFFIRRATTTGAYTGGVSLINAATSWSSASDENIKDIIEPIENAIEKVSTLRTVIGKYKDEEEGVRHPFLIAQDVEKVLPEAVGIMYKGEDNECLGLAYTDTIPLLVAAIQEQQAIINELKTRIEVLENK